MRIWGKTIYYNAIEARNPLYPFPLKIFNCEILEGSSKWNNRRNGFLNMKKNRAGINSTGGRKSTENFVIYQELQVRNFSSS